MMQMKEKRNLRFWQDMQVRLSAASMHAFQQQAVIRSKPDAPERPTFRHGQADARTASVRARRSSVFQSEADLHRHLKMAYLALFQVSAGRHHLEPADITQCVRRAIEAD